MRKMVSYCDDYTAESFLEGSSIILKCIEIIAGNETINCGKNSEVSHYWGIAMKLKLILLPLILVLLNTVM